MAYLALGDDLGMDQLARDAQAILSALPKGSGVNPIGLDPRYPWPHNPDQVSVVDPVYGGNRYEDYYTVYPVNDASGLFRWTGVGGAIMNPGLSQAQSLAAQVLLAGGDTSWSADFHAGNLMQLNEAPSSQYRSDPVDTTTYTPIAPPDLGPAYSGDASIHGTPTPGVITGTIAAPTSSGGTLDPNGTEVLVEPEPPPSSGFLANGEEFGSWATGTKLALGVGGLGLLLWLGRKHG